MREAEEILALTKRLMSFRTVSDNPKELRRCIDFIENYFSGTGVCLKRFVRNTKPSLIITLRETKSPELFLVGHIDVVPAPDKLFIPRIKGRYLYGRGSSDDKSQVAIMLVLMKHYSRLRETPDLGLMIVSDEETGSRYGVQQLIKDYSSSFAIVLDGGDDYEIVTKEKGPLHLKIRARGKSAHGATPWEGINAIDKLINVYLKLKTRFPRNKGWSNTISLGMINGGSVINQVPDHAEMGLDMRFISDREKAEMLSFIKRMKGLELELVSTGDVLDVNPRNRYIRRLRKAGTNILGKSQKIGRMNGATDARFFFEKGIPSVLLSPLGDGHHSADERVELKSLEKIYLILKEFIDESIRTQPQKKIIK